MTNTIKTYARYSEADGRTEAVGFNGKTRFAEPGWAAKLGPKLNSQTFLMKLGSSISSTVRTVDLYEFVVITGGVAGGKVVEVFDSKDAAHDFFWKQVKMHADDSARWVPSHV